MTFDDLSEALRPYLEDVQRIPCDEIQCSMPTFTEVKRIGRSHHPSWVQPVCATYSGWSPIRIPVVVVDDAPPGELVMMFEGEVVGRVKLVDNCAYPRTKPKEQR